MEFFGDWREGLAYMLTPPWQSSDDPDYDKPLHVMVWLLGWLYTLAGIIGSGVFAPYFVALWHVPQMYQEYVIVVIAFTGGFIWQGLALLISVSDLFVLRLSLGHKLDNFIMFIFMVISLIFVFAALLLPFGLTAFLLYWYFVHFAPHHNLVGSGILGATLLKLSVSFGIPLVKSFFTGTALRWTLKKIRGNPPKRDTLTPAS